MNKEIAKVHAQYVLQYVQKMNCPLEQKIKLVEAAAKTVKENIKTEQMYK